MAQHERIEAMDTIIRESNNRREITSARVRRLHFLGHSYPRMAAAIGWTMRPSTLRYHSVQGDLVLSNDQMRWLAEIEKAAPEPFHNRCPVSESEYETRCRDAAESMGLQIVTYSTTRKGLFCADGRERRFATWGGMWRCYLKGRVSKLKSAQVSGTAGR